MQDFDIIIPVHNEGKNLINVFDHLKKNVKSKFCILICYDDKNDNLFEYLKDLKNKKILFKLVKNKFFGACGAVKTGFIFSKAKAVIVYPADDFINGKILDRMYKKFLKGSDIVAASRFMKGGDMRGCPLIKFVLVRFASLSLYWFSSIPIQDASNGFRLFSKRLLNSVKVESDKGFAYSLELLVKAERLGMKISEIPSVWEERSVGESKFKIYKWFFQYLKWYIYGFKTTWLGKKKLFNTDI